MRPIFRIDSPEALKRYAEKIWPVAVEHSFKKFTPQAIQEMLELGLNRKIRYRNKVFSLMVSYDDMPNGPKGRHISMGVLADQLDEDLVKELVVAFLGDNYYEYEAVMNKNVRHFFEKAS